MKIFVAHSSSFDFQKHLYAPVRASSMYKEHTIVLPMEADPVGDTHAEILSSSIVIAEVSRASTGMGIELGWADAANIPIICIYITGSKPSDALKSISTVFVQYQGPKDMIEKIQTALTAVRSTM